MRETELARPVIEYMAVMGWDAYHEVDLGKRADLVFVSTWKPRLVYVVELKTSLSFSLIQQAHHWLPYAHFVAVGAPECRGRRGHGMADLLLRHLGIGRFAIGGSCLLCESPRFNRRANADRILKVLCDEHKTFAPAGNSTGKRWTTFQNTVKQARLFIKQNGGSMSVKAVMDGINHHYSSDASARRSFIELAKRDVLDGISLDCSEKPFRLVVVDRRPG